jgi:hypothetical protein
MKHKLPRLVDFAKVAGHKEHILELPPNIIERCRRSLQPDNVHQTDPCDPNIHAYTNISIQHASSLAI